jgi:hypothetical protein
MTHWDHNGIKVPNAPRTQRRSDDVSLTDSPARSRVQFPFELREVQSAIRSSDLNSLLRLRDRLTAFMALATEREVSFREPDRDELHALQDAIKAGISELTASAVALSDRPYDRYATPRDRPGSPLRGGEDPGLAARVESARKAISEPVEIATGDDPVRRAERDALPLSERVARAKRGLEGR